MIKRRPAHPRARGGASPSHFSKRFLKQGSKLKKETEYGHPDSGPTERRGSIFSLSHGCELLSRRRIPIPADFVTNASFKGYDEE
jgi:hypothetical protein